MIYDKTHLNIYLPSLTSLPENTKFENRGSVYLGSLTSLPENTKFENQGSVDLPNLTSLPENTKFENQGSVDLSNLTSLPENTKFENQGSVYLSNLTSLPENTKFENQGSVYLGSLEGKHVYRGGSFDFRNIDGYTMIVDPPKKVGEFILMKARYLRGGDLDKLPKCFVAKRGKFSAHGETARDAIEDVGFKYAQASLDVGKLVSEIKKSGHVSMNDYRLLTGACRLGCERFIKENGLELGESVELGQALELVRGEYGGDRMAELFS